MTCGVLRTFATGAASVNERDDEVPPLIVTARNHSKMTTTLEFRSLPLTCCRVKEALAEMWMAAAAWLRHPTTGHSCQMVLMVLLLLLMLVLMLVLLMLLLLMLLLQLTVMLDLVLLLLMLLVLGRSYGDAVVVLVVQTLVVWEGPVAGQRVGAFEA